MYKSKSTDERDDLASGEAIVDRRRPGRLEYWNPFLIALLRRESKSRSDQVDPPLKSDGDDDCSDRLPAGIAIACIATISLLLWALVGLGVWLLLV